MANPEITYDLIEPLIVSEEVDGRQVHCQFALPGSVEVFESSAGMKRERSLGSSVKRNLTRNLSNEARRTASRLLRSVFGGGFLGRTAAQTVNTASRESTRSLQNSFSKSQRQAAVVEAFKKVSSNFLYDNGWRKPSAAVVDKAPPVAVSAFTQQLLNNPVRSGFECDVLARMLAKIAYVDGEVASEELEFFKDSIPSSLGTLAELNAKDDISSIEANELDRGVRETIYMLAWSISAIDMEVDDSEVELLYHYRDTFGIPTDRATDLEILAKINVLEGYLSEDIPREELFSIAFKIGISKEDAERAKIHWMKRQ